MAREIKFRGKAAGTWYFGNLQIRKISRKQSAAWIIGYDESPMLVSVDPSTVGQFTGLLDKNGKEIYEGDIIYSRFGDGSDCLCVVGFDEKLLAFGIMDEYAYLSKLQGYAGRYYENYFMHNVYKNSVIFEVRGNIYDNPELLKGGEV